jgi:hypothetical protein
MSPVPSSLSVRVAVTFICSLLLTTISYVSVLLLKS